MREPDKAKYEIYDALKSALPRANSWQELATILVKEGISVEFKTKGVTSQIEGVKFSKNGYSFFGSKVDKQFSYSKIDFALQQNSRAEQQQLPSIQQQQPQPKQEFTPTDSGDFSIGLGGLFDDLLTPNPANDAEEDEFRRQMQRKKKTGIRR